MNLTDPNLWYQVALFVAPLVLAAMHQRNVKLPFIENVLNWILNKPATPVVPTVPGVPAVPATPGTPAAPHPILNTLLALFQAALAGRTVTGVNVTPSGDTVTATVSLLPK